ncbi:sensor histidine kinase, partial [Streptococcus suis]|uniref:sensor histidine kinase n=1 Tax=Streptococcus suis TaxID=1307 RepID=UPI00370C9C72
DNGIGFEDEYRERIFDVFQRLHPAHRYPGTGIGLAICKKIMENHKGFLIASSELGVGSIFNAYFPVE